MADEDRRARAWARRYHRSDLADTLQGTRCILARLDALDQDSAEVDGVKSLMHAITMNSLDTRALLDWDAARFNNQGQATVKAERSTSEYGPQLRFSVPRADRSELDADSLLRAACTTGNKKAAAVALSRGAHVNGCKGKAPGGPYDPPVCLAVSGGHLELVKFLITEGGARVQQPDLVGMYPVVTATQAGNAELVELLCRAGKARATRRCPNGGTPLILASRAGHADVVRTLLKLGASIELKTIEGETALVHACRNNHTDIAQLLLLRGVDVNTPLRQQKFARCRLPIHEVCFSGNHEVLRTLVRIMRGNDDDDALSLEEGTLRRNFLMRTTDGGGMTPLGIAAANGRTRCLRELSEILPRQLLNELIEAPSMELGLTPLALAARGGHKRSVGLLLQWGAIVGAKGSRGMDAVALAGMHGHTEVVRLLCLEEERRKSTSTQ